MISWNNKSYIVLLIALVFSSAINVESNDDAEQNLMSLCEKKPVDLTKISQVKSIGELLGSSSSNVDCPQDIHDAILDMLPVISEGLEDVCTQEKAEQIRNYHLTYISTNQCPKPLRDFFFAYGLTISGICKKNMIVSLLVDTHEYLNGEDFSNMESWTRNEDSLLNALGGPTDYDDILLASDLSRVGSSDDSSSGSDKFFIQVASGKLLKKIQSSCINRFKPFYERTILPIVTLSNLGYNYKGEELEKELKEMKTNSEISLWYKIVFLCESLLGIEIVEESEDQEKTEGLDQKLIRVLSKEEVAALKEEAALTNGRQVVEESQPDLIVYEQEDGNPIGDTVISKGDETLIKLINDFDFLKKESDRIRNKVLHKIGSFMKDYLLKGKLRVIGDFLGKKFGNKPEQGQQNNDKAEMIKAIDAYVEHATKSGVDEPVSGLKDYSKRIYHQAQYNAPTKLAAASRLPKENKSWVRTFFKWAAVFLFIFAVTLCIVG